MLTLSEGALEVIMNGGTVDAPVMQILGSKKLASGNSTERYRLLISDGKHFNSFAMVATQLNSLVASGQLSDFTVVKVNRYITSVINNTADKERRVMVILELDIVKKGSEVGVRIGVPTNFDGSSPGINQPTVQQQPVPTTPSSALKQATSSMNYGNQVRMSPGPNSTIHPISSLNPYQNRWCIKARVTNKQAPRTYTNARGEGKLFSVTFTDETGEIKCTGFNSAVDKFAELLELNKVYMVSNCSIKPANKKFTQADYEMTFLEESCVVPCADDVALPPAIYNFVSISKIAELNIDSVVDVIGIATQASELQTLVARNTGKELKKREITLVDQSKVAVALTLWGTQAAEFDTNRQCVVAVKGAKLNDFMGGRSISVLMSSTLQIDPDIEEAHKLRGWYDNGGAAQEVSSISAKTGGVGGTGGNWIMFGDLTSQGLGMGDKADYFSGVVWVLMARSENCVYKACPSQDCKKKVMDMNNGQFRCEKCNRDYSDFSYRLLLSVQVSDFTGSSWVTLFNDEAEKLLGTTAKFIGEAIDNRDESYKEHFTNLNFKKFQMKFRTKVEAYNDEKRLKTTAVSVDPVEKKSYIKRLLEGFKTGAGITTGI